MRKFAAHLLYLSAVEKVLGPVIVLLDQEGLVESYEKFSVEQPGVEWLGGIFLLLPVLESPESVSCSFEDWYKKVSSVYQPNACSYALWHVNGIPVDADLSRISKESMSKLK